MMALCVLLVRIYMGNGLSNNWGIQYARRSVLYISRSGLWRAKSLGHRWPWFEYFLGHTCRTYLMKTKFMCFIYIVWGPNWRVSPRTWSLALVDASCDLGSKALKILNAYKSYLFYV